MSLFVGPRCDDGTCSVVKTHSNYRKASQSIKNTHPLENTNMGGGLTAEKKHKSLVPSVEQ